MKALTFFSSFKKGSGSPGEFDIEALKNSVLSNDEEKVTKSTTTVGPTSEAIA